jgi:hypothetical protein
MTSKTRRPQAAHLGRFRDHVQAASWNAPEVSHLVNYLQELRALWWRLAYQRVFPPSQTGVIVIDGGRWREEIRVGLSEYKRYQLVDTRMFAPGRNTDVMVPTKAGIACKLELLPKLIEALQRTEGEARKRGLLP